MSYFLSVKISKDKYKTFTVDKEIYIYVRQLENAIVHEETKKRLKELYPSRFEFKDFIKEDIDQNKYFQEYETKF